MVRPLASMLLLLTSGVAQAANCLPLYGEGRTFLVQGGQSGAIDDHFVNVLGDSSDDGLGTYVQSLQGYFGSGTLGLFFGTDNIGTQANNASLWSIEP